MSNLFFEYPFTKESVVLDCGGYRGEFALDVLRRYGCYVTVFEPISVFAEMIRNSLRSWGDRIEVVNAAIGGKARLEEFHIQNDSTGIFSTSQRVEGCPILDVADVLNEFPSVDLLKLNIEGMEFEVLERIIELDLVGKLKNIQVQFHPVAPDCEARYKAIRSDLLKTHKLTLDHGWVWSHYEKFP